MIRGCRLLASVGVRFDRRAVRELMVSIVGWTLFGWAVELDSMISAG